MAYASIDDLKAVGLRGKALEGIDPLYLVQQLANASGVVDTYLPSHYNTPLPLPAHPSIVEATVAIAAYRILNWRGYRPGSHDDEVRARYQDAMAWLEMLSKGSVSLSAGSDGTLGGEGAPRVTTGGSARTAAAPTTDGAVRGW